MQIQSYDTRGEVDLRSYLGILWRRRWWIVGVTVGIGLLALLNALRHDERYRANAALLISAPPEASVPIGNHPLSDNPDRQMANEIQLINSRDLREAVYARVGRHLSISAENPADTDVIDLSSTNTDADQAATDVNDFVTAYLAERQAQNEADIADARAEVAQDRAEKRQALEDIRQPLRELEAQRRFEQDPTEIIRLTAAADAEARRIASAEQDAINALQGFDSVIAQLDGLAELDDPGVEVISQANVPTEPYYPQPRKDLLVGLSIGLLLGLAVALLREFGDDRILTEDDLERALPDVPLVSIIPELDAMGGGHLVTSLDSREGEIGIEAYRSLAASVEFSSLGKPVTIIHVTSSVEGEGKSTTAANLAMAFAETGTRVAAIDADLRRPSLHAMLGVPAGPGLSAYLTNKVSLEDAMQQVPTAPTLMLLAPGPLPANPTRLLYAQRTEELFDQLRADFDVVVIDSPPLLPVADSLILTQFSDLVLFVACSGRTGRRIVRKAYKAVRRVEAGSMAAVLNRAPRSGPDGYDYYYGRYHHQDGDPNDQPADRSAPGAPA